MNYALLLAAGQSTRFSGNKIFAPLWGKPLIEYSLMLCETSSTVDEVFIACKPGDTKEIKILCEKNLTKPWTLVTGGDSRHESVHNIIAVVSRRKSLNSKDFFIVLNAANPLASASEIAQCLAACTTGVFGAAVGRPITATIKKTARGKNKKDARRVIETIDREDLFEMETPQVVRAQEYARTLDRLKKTAKKSPVFTDELSVLEYAKKKTVTVPAHPLNKKITTSVDLALLNGLTASVGIGEDSHALIKAKKPLILAGITVDSRYAFDADSDGDVVLHAVANALSSSMGGSSLGTFATAMCEDGIIDSREYVRAVLKKMHSRNISLRIGHLSLSIEGAHPKIDALAARMRDSLSTLLEVPRERIGITATTGKQHTAYGKGAAVKAVALILLHYAPTLN